MRLIATTFLLGLIFLVIVWLFYYQQFQYLLPTPVPKNYQVVLAGQVVTTNIALPNNTGLNPTFFHFFNPHCPCSRFNLKHFQALKNKYDKQVAFYVVVTSEEKATAAKELLGEDIPILVDIGEKLAKACGVYATPQAVILESNNRLYFRGNYNRARYCTDLMSNYAQMALDSLLANKTSPTFGMLATTSYGCSIIQPKD